MNYEINFLILQSQTENIDKLRSDVKNLIAKHNGKITDELLYQKRKLAYEINHEQYGFYTVYRFDLENGEGLKDLTKDLNLLSGVSRHIIVRSDELPELQKEVGKDTMAEQEKRNASRQAKAPAKKDKEKILKEIDIETKEQKTETSPTKPADDKADIAPRDKAKKAEKVTIAGSDAEMKDEKTTKAKKESTSSDKKAPKKDKKAEEISIEDLDKKLDEILDI